MKDRKMTAPTAPALAIGMAHFHDFQGLWMTVMDLTTHHAEAAAKCELVVVDNSPESSHGRQVQHFLRSGAGEPFANAQYVAMPRPVGTSAPRNAIFTHATAPAVLVVDCHVLLYPGVLARLLEYYEQNPHTTDMLHGPLVFPSHKQYHTHFADHWRGEMWGTWSNAWQCDCGPDGLRFDTWADEHGHTNYRTLTMDPTPVSMCGACGKKLPMLSWPAHEQALTAAGFEVLAWMDDEEPFEIPGQGLGLFSCRTDVWPGFHPKAHGFGGEEMYIHEKFRARGARVLCLPWLRWVHRFGHVDGIKFPLTAERKAGNYILEFQEMGWDPEPIRAHFVDERHKLTESQWDALLGDPAGYAKPAAPNQANGQPAIEGDTLNDMFAWCSDHKRDLNEHLGTLLELANQCDHITEFAKRRESTVAFASSGIRRLISYQLEDDPAYQRIDALLTDNGTEWHQAAVPSDQIQPDAFEPTDLLFIDHQHTATRLALELERFATKVSRYIVMHDTALHGERGEDGQPGLMTALRAFCDANPQWFVVSHTTRQYGLTVIGCRDEDRPAQTVHAWPPEKGPGTELTKMLTELGITAPPGCDCKSKSQRMDNWGVAGCREHFDEIVEWMRNGQDRWGWSDKLRAAGKAIQTGLAFRLNPLDPFPGIITECIRRAEENETEEAAQ